MPPFVPVEIRLKNKIDMKTPDVCWNWKSAKNKQGYGMICIDRKGVLAHRVAYSIFKGEIPPGMCVMHTCDNPSCCNPYHLRTGTVLENNADRHQKNRSGGGSSRGISNPQNKLTEHDVMTIYRSGDSLSKIAQKFGISISTASDIKNGKIWGWLTGGSQA